MLKSVVLPDSTSYLSGIPVINDSRKHQLPANFYVSESIREALMAFPYRKQFQYGFISA